ncbi:hypothetical protein BG011_000197 [Mortierella polycephala]|uniref:Uncharacterized protein n=1 Tax=Mortierella polycephala TaxID=41804 RepID=A0A9P6Q8F4_9FUNG|nr:hypothetical protein BG011_000197 [Mortierella polycephala]
MKFNTAAVLAFVGSLSVLVGNVQAVDWKDYNAETSYAAGREVLLKTGNDAHAHVVGKCAIAGLGLVASASGFIYCMVNPSTPIVCQGKDLSWFQKLVVDAMNAAIKECGNIDAGLREDTRQLKCFASQYVMKHPPPKGASYDVKRHALSCL